MENLYVLGVRMDEVKPDYSSWQNIFQQQQTEKDKNMYFKVKRELIKVGFKGDMTRRQYQPLLH